MAQSARISNVIKHACLVLLLCMAAEARQRYAGYCEQGSKAVVTAGASSATNFQALNPACTVTVYAAGTLSLATIYADNSGTPQMNPFTADTTGYFFFYADNGRFDVTYVSNSMSTTVGDILLYDQPQNINPQLGYLCETGNGVSINPQAWCSPALIAASSYNFTQQATSAALVANVPGAITLTPCPLGVNGTDTGHAVYIVDGGSSEAVQISGGSCTSGAASGTLVVTSVFNHVSGSGVTSATSGIQEAACMGPQTYVSGGPYVLNANVTFCGQPSGYMVIENQADISGPGTLPTAAGWGFVVEDRRANVAPANPTWSNSQLRGSIPAFDYEFQSILLNNHDYRGNVHVPRGTSVSTGSALLVGWTTPTDAQCVGCQAANQQNALALSLLDMNTLTPDVALAIGVNPGVDNFLGIWGININMSNNGHANATSKTGICGEEIDIGIDNAATDTAVLGVGSQVVGLAVNEASTATNKRSTAGIAILGASQNPHIGLVIAATPVPTLHMDKGIRMDGPITNAIDLAGVTSSDVAAIVLPMNLNEGYGFTSGGLHFRGMFSDGASTFLVSNGFGTIFNDHLGNALAAVYENGVGGGFQPPLTTFSQLPAHNIGNTMFICTDCTPNSNPCTGAGSGAMAVLYAGAPSFKCY